MQCEGTHYVIVDIPSFVVKPSQHKRTLSAQIEQKITRISISLVHFITYDKLFIGAALIFHLSKTCSLVLGLFANIIVLEIPAPSTFCYSR